jgi:hypothetical protein
MTCLHDFLAGIEWWQSEPAPEWILNPPAEYRRRTVLARTARRDLAVAYLPDQDGVDIDMSGFPAPVTAVWFDPTNGKNSESGGERTPNQGHREFKPPAKNSTGDNDWVLVLKTTPVPSGEKQ